MVTISSPKVRVIGGSLANQVEPQDSVSGVEGLGSRLNSSVQSRNFESFARALESTAQLGTIADAVSKIVDTSGESFSRHLSLPSDYLEGITNAITAMPERYYEPIEVPSVDMRPAWQQLIVIGNGFDLECDLPSKFEDFFSSRYDVIVHAEEASSSAEQPWGAYLTSHGLTVWDIILQTAHKEYWYDIERAIADWVAPLQAGEAKEEQPPTPIQTVLADIKQFVEDGHHSSGLSPSDFAAIKGETSGIGGAIRFILDNTEVATVAGWTDTDIYDYFFDELNRLESEFGTYLQKAVNADEDGYKDRCIKLLIDLIMDERISEENFKPEESFLSFNYTHPVSVLTYRKDGQPIPMVNVHGSLGSEMVFGIDGSERLNNPNALRFTKTYRLMALGNPDLGKLVHGKGRGLLAGATDMIKFYGHSLSDSDYSYFQAIFDTVALYDGDTTVVFYYRPWKQKDGTKVDEQVARADMMDKVVRLLNSYGQTMENKAHGRNILHKLLIEGRLMVKLLPSAGYRTSHTDGNGLTYM